MRLDCPAMISDQRYLGLTVCAVTKGWKHKSILSNQQRPDLQAGEIKAECAFGLMII
jgi:hypothetical protein